MALGSTFTSTDNTTTLALDNVQEALRRFAAAAYDDDEPGEISDPNFNRHEKEFDRPVLMDEFLDEEDEKIFVRDIKEQGYWVDEHDVDVEKVGHKRGMMKATGVFLGKNRIKEFEGKQFTTDPLNPYSAPMKTDGKYWVMSSGSGT